MDAVSNVPLATVQLLSLLVVHLLTPIFFDPPNPTTTTNHHLLPAGFPSHSLVLRNIVSRHPVLSFPFPFRFFSNRDSSTSVFPVSIARRTFVSRTQLNMKNLKTAIVGLPNVGKSTLFNALTETQGAMAANYPFCTIEPNVGIVTVPDEKLTRLGVIHKSVKTVPAALEFVDVAGLVAGASKGEGLGNQFLANIRECDAIVHVVRCFADENIIHVSGKVDPAADAEIINIELALADLAQVEKRELRVRKDKKPEAAIELAALLKVKAALEAGKSARAVPLTPAEVLAVKNLHLLTMKKVIYAANVADSELAGGNKAVEGLRLVAAAEGAAVVIVSAQVESELALLPVEDRADFLASLGVTPESSGLRALVKAAYEVLGLQTYYTAGPTETKAWTIEKGWTAPKAAGVIHGDFEKGFIRAECISYDDLVKAGDEAKAKQMGLVRSEGKDYVVREGDVILFRFNV